MGRSGGKAHDDANPQASPTPKSSARVLAAAFPSDYQANKNAHFQAENEHIHPSPLMHEPAINSRVEAI